jgi:hypothetical protein
VEEVERLEKRGKLFGGDGKVVGYEAVGEDGKAGEDKEGGEEERLEEEEKKPLAQGPEADEDVYCLLPK